MPRSPPRRMAVARTDDMPATLAGTAGPVSILAWIFGAGAILLALVFANLGRAYPRTGGPYAYARRAFGDFVGFQTAWGLLDRGLGRQRRHRRGVRRLRGGLLVRTGEQQAARRARRRRPDLAAHAGQRPRHARERGRSARHDGAEVRPARRDRADRPVL